MEALVANYYSDLIEACASAQPPVFEHTPDDADNIQNSIVLLEQVIADLSYRDDDVAAINLIERARQAIETLQPQLQALAA